MYTWQDQKPKGLKFISLRSELLESTVSRPTLEPQFQRKMRNDTGLALSFSSLKSGRRDVTALITKRYLRKRSLIQGEIIQQISSAHQKSPLSERGHRPRVRGERWPRLL